MTISGEPAGPASGSDRSLTIAQIAELAGVSVATVSKVVNGRSEVAPDTRGLVENVIRQHGFRRQRRPPQAAANLELVFHQLEGAYTLEIIKGVDRIARENHLSVVLSHLQGEHTPGRGWVESILARRPTAVISVFSGPTPTQCDQLRSRDIPFVLVDPTGEPGHDFPSVGASNWSGGLAATRHLIELGHRRIGIVAGPRRMLSARARLDGYRAALDLAGIPVDPDLIREGEFHVADGFRQTRHLLELPDRPTAIFAGNDAQAIGVYQAAHEAGRRIPYDLSVVGFDDLPPAEWFIPAMTTVRQPLTEMAAEAATMAIALARGEALPRNRLILSTELVVRASTAPPAVEAVRSRS